MSFLSPYYPFPKIRTDVPLSKKAKTDLELEDDEASADMESFETNFVWVNYNKSLSVIIHVVNGTI